LTAFIAADAVWQQIRDARQQAKAADQRREGLELYPPRTASKRLLLSSTSFHQLSAELSESSFKAATQFGDSPRLKGFNSDLNPFTVIN
jgi:hypothetical protein